ncbi:hypothetical protein ENUP19_0054G0072 [Entamoeba nuttalli]|uniref:Uncharacterized protein n=1 Tax=Entamoeba nuttalli TaxID=412467 RepID=A0ABQ0DCD3_9EUKA
METESHSAFHSVRLMCDSDGQLLLRPINSESNSVDNEVNQKNIKKELTSSKSKQNKRQETYQEEMLNAKRKSKNRDAAQQSFLIGLLATFGYELKINKLYKKGKTTSQLFTINSIKKEGTLVYKSYDVVPEVEDLRDKRRCLDAVTNSKLLDLALSHPEVVAVEKKCRISKYGHAIGMRRIKTLSLNGCTLRILDITKLGAQIHNMILEHMGEKDCLVNTQSYDITSVIQNYVSHRIKEESDDSDTVDDLL